MTRQQTTDLLSPADNLEQAAGALLTHGICVIHNAIEFEACRQIRAALYTAANDDQHGQHNSTRFALDRNEHNQRVWNLLNRDPVFSYLAEHPSALFLVEKLLSWPALLSNISGNITEPGAAPGVLHADQIFVPEPWPKAPQGLNLLWCIDEFTEENGATEIVPRSHLLHRNPGPADASHSTVPIIAPAGSLVAFESRLWHRSGANSSASQTRAGIFAFYSTPVYRTQENWFLSLHPDVLSQASETLLTLLAYHSDDFGLVYGESPHLRGGPHFVDSNTNPS